MSVDPREIKACPVCGRRRAVNASRAKNPCQACSTDADKKAPGAWMDEAACRNPIYDAEWWWACEPKDFRGRMAVAICRELCPVRDQCLAHALDQREVNGIWGGTKPEERRGMLRRVSTVVETV